MMMMGCWGRIRRGEGRLVEFSFCFGFGRGGVGKSEKG